VLNFGERQINLGGGIRAIVSKEHTFGADAVLLAHFSRPKAGQRLCDLGTGCGIIPLLWCAKGGPFAIDAFEIQEQAADIAKRAAEINNLDIHVFNADLRHIDTLFNNSYDLITCNPPYNRLNAAHLSLGAAAAAARHEVACTIEDVVATAAMLLKHGGRLCLCHRPERLTDIVGLMRSSGIEPKRLQFAQHNRAAKPWLMLIEGRQGARPGIETQHVLLAAEDDGSVSAEMKAIYGDYN
jgi:tRNA1Val (adenine37-N6)-methyltransferase